MKSRRQLRRTPKTRWWSFHRRLQELLWDRLWLLIAPVVRSHCISKEAKLGPLFPVLTLLVSNTPSSQIPFTTPSLPGLNSHVSNPPPPSQVVVNSAPSSQFSTEEARDTQVPPSNTDSGSVSIQAETTTQFVPFLGSWAKPLIFKPLATPPDPSTPREYDSVGNQLASLWPSLNNEILNKKQKSKYPTRT